MATRNSTIPHGSDRVQISSVFCCCECYARVAMVVLPGGDLAYECQNPGCGKTVHSDLAETLALVEDIAIELVDPRELATEAAL